MTGMLRNEAGQCWRSSSSIPARSSTGSSTLIVENLRAIGIDARLNRIDNAQISERQRSGDFDIITDHFPMGYEPGSGLRQYFGSLGADEALFNSCPAWPIR